MISINRMSCTAHSDLKASFTVTLMTGPLCSNGTLQNMRQKMCAY